VRRSRAQKEAGKGSEEAIKGGILAQSAKYTPVFSRARGV
jgi:hypothetical protein